MAELPTTLYTERLVLRWADPDDENDCTKIISIYNDAAASMGSNTKVGMNTIADIYAKHHRVGPKRGFCKKAPPPKRMFHLAYLKSDGADEVLVGQFMLNFRDEMPCPDLGWALLRPYWGSGYASEGGREVLRFWREEVGVEKIFAGMLDSNDKSQRCAERIGFVLGGRIDIGDDRKRAQGLAMVLPGMTWRDFDENGQRWCFKPTVAVETKAPKTDPLDAA